MNNSRAEDSSAKLVFGDNKLCAQFINRYLGIDALLGVRPEDIEDITTQYLPMFTEERDSDVVKRVSLPDGEKIFFLLIEHKSDVAYNTVMQVLRYMIFIWEDYETKQEKQRKGISRTAGFKYPPILPVVYYTGKRKWTAAQRLSERIFLSDIFAPYTPDYRYKMICLDDYTSQELMVSEDELSLVMMINKLRNLQEFRELGLTSDYFNRVLAGTADSQLQVISIVVAALLRKYNMPEDDISDFTDNIKERNMGDLFAHIKPDEEYAEMRREIQELSLERDSLNNEIGSLNNEIGSLNNEVESLNGEIGSLNNEIGSLNGEIGSLNNEIGSLNNEVESLNGEIGSLNNEIGSLNNEVESLNGEIGSLNNEVESLNGEIGSLNNEVDSLTRQHSEDQAEIMRLRAQLARKTRLRFPFHLPRSSDKQHTQ